MSPRYSVLWVGGGKRTNTGYVNMYMYVLVQYSMLYMFPVIDLLLYVCVEHVHVQVHYLYKEL